MTLEHQARLFAAAYPTPASHPYGGDGSWDQDCGRACNRFSEWLGYTSWPRADISSAYRVAMASGPLNPDPAAAGPALAQGWLIWHYWDIGGEANGHVATQVDSNGLVFMGSASVWEDLGVDVGFSSVAAYQAYRPTARYLGWAANYAGGTVDISRFLHKPSAAPAAPITEGTQTMADRQYFARIKADGTDDREWMLTGRDIIPEEVDQFDTTKVRYFDGFQVTTDLATAIRWARAYGIGPTQTLAVRLQRDAYVAQQKFATEDAQRYRAFLQAQFRAAAA